MKILKYISVSVSLAIFLFISCEPIEDRDTLNNSFIPENIVLKAVQSTTGGNEILLKIETPGVTGYWDFNIGNSYTDEV